MCSAVAKYAEILLELNFFVVAFSFVVVGFESLEFGKTHHLAQQENELFCVEWLLLGIELDIECFCKKISKNNFFFKYNFSLINKKSCKTKKILNQFKKKCTKKTLKNLKKIQIHLKIN